MIFIEAVCDSCGEELEITNRSDCFGIKFGVMPCSNCVDYEFDRGRESANEEAYNDGYNQGMHDNENSGYDDGYDGGYMDGKYEGYNEGFDAGYEKACRECERDNDL